MLKSFLKLIITKLYKVKIEGVENFDKAGDRVLVVANHLSFLDALLLGLFLPEKMTFAVNTYIAQKWWIKPFLSMANCFALDPTNPLATKGLIEQVKQGNKVVIFPEGRITVTGSMMKIYEGPGMIADKSDAFILPIRLEGAQYSPFSRLKGKVRIRLFPEIIIKILEPRKLEISAEIKGRKRRHLAGVKLYDLMSEMMFESSKIDETFFQSLIHAKAIHGRKHEIIFDVERKPLTYNQLITKSFALGNEISKNTKSDEYVGILLPNMVNSIVTFFALQAYGRTPAMLNFSAGSKSLISACKTAKIKTIYTSRKFIEAGKLEEVVNDIRITGVKIICLEDLAPKITTIDKLIALTGSYFPQTYYNKICKNQNADDAGVVLFTSGSEGTPKGVVLSHQNIQANRQQLASRIDFGPSDIIFNSLPIFHSFGLTGATLLPILSGIKTFFYPSPLHYRIVPEIVYDINATIMFGTDTFLSGYARFAHPYDFYSVRYVFAGAEKLKEETRKTWSEKFGARIFEGYGATETAPALSSNTPMHNKPGTVGRILPSIKCKLEAVEGIENGGRLYVEGPNVMKGYLMADNPGELLPPEGGIYDTGDIVEFDEDGYISIKGRAKRFAKIAGEMVSLTAVEGYMSAIWAENDHAIIAIPDDKKGEQLIMITNHQNASKAEILNYVKENGISELSIPKKIINMEKIPLLGTGKVDYVTIKELVSGG